MGAHAGAHSQLPCDTKAPFPFFTHESVGLLQLLTCERSSSRAGLRVGPVGRRNIRSLADTLLLLRSVSSTAGTARPCPDIAASDDGSGAMVEASLLN